MTEDRMALRELFEKRAAADLLREMIGFAAERLMELDAGKPTRARHGQRSPQRLVQRNGYQTPSAYAAWLTATHDRPCVVEVLRQPTVVPSAQERQGEAPAPVSG